jgi:hypothetical protein
MASCSKIICVGCAVDLSTLDSRDRRNLGSASSGDPERALSGWISLVSKHLAISVEEAKTSIDIAYPGKMCFSVMDAAIIIVAVVNELR